MGIGKRLLCTAAEIGFYSFIGGMFTATAITREEYLLAAGVAAFFVVAALSGLVFMWTDIVTSDALREKGPLPSPYKEGTGGEF